MVKKMKQNPPRDLLRKRAKARAALTDPAGRPTLSVKFVRTGGSGLCESIGALTWSGDRQNQYARAPGETEEAFERRVVRDLPLRAPAGLVFWPVIDELDPLNQDTEP